LTGDLVLFHGISADLFPNIPLPTFKYGQLIDTIKHVCEQGILISHRGMNCRTLGFPLLGSTIDEGHCIFVLILNSTLSLGVV